MVVVGPEGEIVGFCGDPGCPSPSCPWFSLATDGVVGPDPGIGGRLSNKDAPKDDDGLKVFSPVNAPRPVVCEVSPVGWADIEGTVEVVAPVGWEETEEKRVSVEKLLFVVDVIWGERVFALGLFPKPSVAKSEATLDIVEPALGLDVGEDICPGCPFCCCCCCCCICRSSCCLFIASSIRVGTFGTGGGGEVGIPNGFFDPVCCATRGLIGSGESVFIGTDAGRGGINMFTGFCSWGGGCDCCCCICCGNVNGEFMFDCWLVLNGLAGLNGVCCCCPGV